MAQSQRRQPRQARAVATQAAIFEATAQILEGQGEGALTTNAIAERAGISIATLYQYHADKASILVAMALAENAKVREALIAAAGPDGVSPARHYAPKSRDKGASYFPTPAARWRFRA